MELKEFSAMNRRRCESPKGFNHPIETWDVSDWFLAVLGEIGEAANIAKKLNRVRDGIRGNLETEAELRAELRKEIGDAFVYLDLLAQHEGFYLEDAALEVFHAKSTQIGYSEDRTSPWLTLIHAHDYICGRDLRAADILHRAAVQVEIEGLRHES